MFVIYLSQGARKDLQSKIFVGFQTHISPESKTSLFLPILFRPFFTGRRNWKDIVCIFFLNIKNCFLAENQNKLLTFVFPRLSNLSSSRTTGGFCASTSSQLQHVFVQNFSNLLFESSNWLVEKTKKRYKLKIASFQLTFFRTVDQIQLLKVSVDSVLPAKTSWDGIVFIFVHDIKNETDEKLTKVNQNCGCSNFIFSFLENCRIGIVRQGLNRQILICKRFRNKYICTVFIRVENCRGLKGRYNLLLLFFLDDHTPYSRKQLCRFLPSRSQQTFS